MSANWVRSQTATVSTRRLVSIYKLPTNDFSDIEKLLPHLGWGKGNSATCLAMAIGARVLNELINQGKTLDEAMTIAAKMLDGPNSSSIARVLNAGTAESVSGTRTPSSVETIRQSGVVRGGVSKTAENMFVDDDPA